MCKANFLSIKYKELGVICSWLSYKFSIICVARLFSSESIPVVFAVFL